MKHANQASGDSLSEVDWFAVYLFTKLVKVGPQFETLYLRFAMIMTRKALPLPIVTVN